MLTEGWDANTVTHVLGVRAFGTQLAVRAGHRPRPAPPVLRPERGRPVQRRVRRRPRHPFDFTAKPVVAPPQPPRETIQVKAIRPTATPARSASPACRATGSSSPKNASTAEFNADSTLELTPDLVGPSITKNAGIIGEGVDLTWSTPATCALHAALPPDPAAALHQVARPRRGAEAPPLRPAQAHRPQWLEEHLWSARAAPTRPAHVPGAGRHGLRAHHRRHHRVPTDRRARPIKAVLDPYNPTGSTAHVASTPRRRPLGDRSRRSATSTGSLLDSDWEAEFCRVAETTPVRAYVKNHNLGFEVPYRYGSEPAPTCPTSSSWSTTATAPTTCCTWSSRSRATGARTPRRRSHHGHLLGARREQPRQATAAGPSPSSPTSTRWRPTSRPRSNAFESMIDGVLNTATATP
jgi:type III restriction enzyme